jgi:MYXO-CTERM domain-containing protein
MRVTRACVFLACAIGLSAPAFADDGGADAAAGGSDGGGSSGSGGEGAIAVQETSTPDNLGCSTAPASPGTSAALAGLALLGVASWVRRRRRAFGALAGAGLAAASSASPARADGPPPAPPPAPAPVPMGEAPGPPSLYTADTVPPAERTAPVRFGFGALLTTDFYGAPIEVNGQAKGQLGVLGVGAFVELGRGEDAGVWAPLVRLTGARASTDATGAMSTATYTWYTLAADFCPIQASLTHGLWVRPCARVTGGLLTAAASLGNQAYGAQQPWVSAGLLGRLQWRPVGPLFFEVQGGAAYAFTHDAVSLGPTPAVMSAIPTLTPASFEPFGALGVGLTFP